VHNNIAVIPLPDSRLSHWHRLSLAPDEGAGSHTAQKKPDRVLIIEDDLLIAAQIEATLADEGFEIIAVTGSGEEALELAKAQRPTLAVIDIRLSGDRDGVDTAIELFRSHGVRCVFASAFSDQDARRRAEPAAPLGWVQKPYTMASLTATVRAAVNEVRSKQG